MTLEQQLQATLGAAYTVTRELGGGGMSRVFVAEELRLKRPVVVKVLSPELAQGISVDRFEREIQTVAALQHANIVPVLTAGDTDGLPFYTMPFVEGDSLRARLGGGPFAVSEVIGILRDVSKALAYAHQRGVVHRDIKPDNVLISGGVAVVTDFGIAKAISASRTASRSATLTQIGTSIGTPAYMAPEQAAGDPDVDGRADIYSLGAMAYELLSGKVVFSDRSAQRMLAAHMSEAPTPITALRPDVPAPLAALVMQCLAKNPDDRPQSAGEIARVLDTVSSGTAHEAMPPLLAAPGMFSKALAIYAVTFVVVAIVARAAIVGIGLPDWVFPAALIVMALGLPAVLWTGYVQRVARRALTMTPTFTPGGSPSTIVQGTMATMALKAAPRMSWSKTARGGMYALGGLVVLVTGFMAMRALGIGPAGSLFATGKLRPRDKIVMTDFVVANGDTSLASVMSTAVRMGLSQSSVLTIVDPAVVAGTLERMERPRNAHVDVALAQGIAEREGAKAVVDGVVTTIGTGYVLTVRLLSADSAHVLASFQASGDGTKGLLAAADQVSRELRAKAGESLRFVQSAVPLARGRTASLEALRLYSDGSLANSVERNPFKAVRLLRQAVRIDTLFAQAWMTLSAAMHNASLPRSGSDSAATRGYLLRDRLPEGERMEVEAEYYATGPGRDRVKGIAAFERAVQLGVSKVEDLNDLAVAHSSRREFAVADSIYRLAIAADSTWAIAQGGLIRVLEYEGRLDAADSLIATARKRFPGSSIMRAEALRMLWNRGRFDEFQRQADSATAVRDAASPSLPFALAADVALVRGHLSKAYDLRARGDAADSAAGKRTSPVGIAQRNLFVAEFVGRGANAETAALETALAATNLRSIPDADRPDLGAAQVLAIAGQTDRARRILTDFSGSIRDTTERRYREPAFERTRGIIALSDRKPAEAIAAFRRADIASDGPVDVCTICLPDNLARAFDAANQPDSAIKAYETYIVTPMWSRVGLDALRLPAAHERLGQLYEAKGNTAKAMEHYNAFIELWKNADPELQPRVASARRSVARLTAAEKR